MAEGHNWDNINNIILTSYTWAADKQVQAINRAHRITSRRDVNLYVILCDQSADRVLEDNINEKTNSSELAIDGRLLGEASEERSVAELLREAMRDFREKQDCPNEEVLCKTWPQLCEQLREAARGWHGPQPRRSPIEIDLAHHRHLPDALGKTANRQSSNLAPHQARCIAGWLNFGPLAQPIS